MPLRVIILAGPIGSGKSTRLAAWCLGRGDVGGVLQMRTPGGRRLVAIGTDLSQPLESRDQGEAAVNVGRFRFRTAAFAFANAHLHAVAMNTALGNIIVDEVGPLELSGSGMADGVRTVLARDHGAAVLLVRDGLVRDVARAFGLDQPLILDAANWPAPGSPPP